MSFVILFFFLALQITFVVVGRRTFCAAEYTGLRRIDVLAATISTGNILLVLFFPASSTARVLCAAALLAASAALFAWSVASVRGTRLPFIHDSGSADELVSSGAFGFVRNPFYLSYLFAYAAVIPATSSLWTYVLFGLVCAVYWEAVRSEEAALRAGPFAEEYAAYTRCTGRFIPRLRRREV